MSSSFRLSLHWNLNERKDVQHWRWILSQCWHMAWFDYSASLHSATCLIYPGCLWVTLVEDNVLRLFNNLLPPGCLMIQLLNVTPSRLHGPYKVVTCWKTSLIWGMFVIQQVSWPKWDLRLKNNLWIWRPFWRSNVGKIRYIGERGPMSSQRID